MHYLALNARRTQREEVPLPKEVNLPMALCIHFDDPVFLLQSEWLGPRLQSDQGARLRRCSLVETIGPGGDPRGRRIVKTAVILHEIPTNPAVESAERRL